MAARNFLPRCTALELQIFNDFIGIRLNNAVHLGKKFLAAIFSTIVYSRQKLMSLISSTNHINPGLALYHNPFTLANQSSLN